MECVDLQGELEEHEKLVAVMKEVDVVISALAYPQVLDQFKILEAIKAAGNIKVNIRGSRPFYTICSYNVLLPSL